MSVLNFVQFYKDILDENEHSVLTKFAPLACEGNTSACALFCSRFSRERSEEILYKIINDKNCLGLLNLFFFIGATESVYVRYKNEKLLSDCYEFCSLHMSWLKSQTDENSLSLCAFCFDKLRFFASVLNKPCDKAEFSNQCSNALNKINSLPFSLVPLFTLSYSQEEVEEKVTTIDFTCENSYLALTYALLSIRGLISYGYYDLADKYKAEIYKNIQPVLSLDSFSSAVLCEIALTD